ncbi:unnamed protein product [Plutella xylostella]|uniref:Odorant receptor n=1 Tax=Plutella xylostella TaxID=51655 RepID=A0A8S4EQK9_PLUXY|nr:unnamed protein product [Plutella xylostella]
MEIPSFQDLVGQIKVNFRYTGMAYERPQHSIIFYIPFIVITGVVIEETAFFVSRMSSENFLELTELAPCLAMGLLSQLKILPIFLKKEKVYKLTEALEILYNSIRNDPAQVVYVKNDVVQIKILIKYYFILNVILIVCYNFWPLLIMLYNYAVNGEIQFLVPYAILVPFSYDSLYTWFPVFFHLISGGFICVLYFTTVDALYFFLTSQVCIQFLVLSNELEKLQNNEQSKLKDIVKKHQYILSLSDDLEDIFSLPNFFNVIVGSTLICALGFNLTTGELAKMPKFLLFLSSVLLQILMMSVFGEHLIQESGRIADAVYLCRWYEMDQSTKNSILIIMRRARRAQKMTAYRFSVISYGSFTKIISTSWSYFTILRTVYKPDIN